jgi:hypothetical protein
MKQFPASVFPRSSEGTCDTSPIGTGSLDRVVVGEKSELHSLTIGHRRPIQLELASGRGGDSGASDSKQMKIRWGDLMTLLRG